MNGFLIRTDGALINIDRLLYIQKEPLTDGEWNVQIYLVGNISVTWNKDPVTEETANRLLVELRGLIQDAIQFP